MTEEIVLRAKWTYESDALKRLQADVDTTQAKVSSSTEKMGRDSIKLMRNVAHLTTAFSSLEGVVSKVQSGEMGLGEASLRLIPTFVSLTASIWGIVTAEKARAIASAIAHGVLSMGMLTPIIVSAAALAAGAAVSAFANIPSKQAGGFVPSTRPYLLHAGEYVLTAERVREVMTPEKKPSNVYNFNITLSGYADTKKAGDDFIQALRAGGFI